MLRDVFSHLHCEWKKRYQKDKYHNRVEKISKLKVFSDVETELHFIAALIWAKDKTKQHTAMTTLSKSPYL